jgi:signal transduction histidine kinase
MILLTDLSFSIGDDVIRIENLISLESEIITDATRIRIVLNNIVSNAIRYHDKYKENCSITIEEHAKESITKLSGTIAAESQQGVGSTFSITLPIADVDKKS